MKKIISVLSFIVPVAIILAAAFSFNHSSFRKSGYFKISGDQIRFAKDEVGNEDLNRVLALNFQPLPAGSSDPNFGFSSSDIWLRFELDPTKISSVANILQINNPLLDVVQVYELSDEGPILMVNTGDRLTFKERPTDHRLFRIPVRLESDKKEFLLRINSGGEQCLAPISIWTEEALESRDEFDQLVRGIYFGLVAFVLLFTLFLYLRLRETSSLYYVQYNANLMLLQAALCGYTFRYFWPDVPYLANISTPLFASLSILSLLKFAQHFLELARYYPKTNKIFNYVGYIVLGNAALSFIPFQLAFQTSVVAINIVALLLNFAIVPVAYGVLKKGYKPAKFFLIGFITLVFTVFGFIGTNIGIIRSDFYADYGLLIGSALEVVLLSFAVVDRFHSFKEQAIETLKEKNRIERNQNEMLERTVEERTREIVVQKLEIENKREEILSSIRYAERIQRNLLPSESEMRKIFPESFVIYKPKDIVSGDFYWVGKSKWNGVESPAHEISLIAAGDCTGHGVPGAMVSVLGCNMLRESLHLFPEAKPGEMLSAMDTRLNQTMTTHAGMHSGDGMDIALCAYQHDSRQLWVSGANIHVWRWNGHDFDIIRGNPRAIGTRIENFDSTFDTNVIELKPGNTVYITTDGFADQFGAATGKKLKSKGLRNFLAQIAHLPMEEQKERTEKFFLEWKGDNEQTDDVCIVAFKIH
jgi:serine phosphatase RsbU (regulator of sigma subunit)